MELTVRRTVKINASINKVWEALTTSEWTRKYMYGAEVISSWKVGSDIHWKGEFQGQEFFLKGKVLEIVPYQKLVYTNFDPAIGLEDKEENYLEVTYELQSKMEQTKLTVTTTNFLGDETRKNHSEQGWDYVLQLLQTELERK